MTDDEKAVLDLWVELKAAAEELDRDVLKNTTKSNVSAGVRVRKGIRKLRALGASMLRAALKADKETVAARKASKPAKVSA